MIDMEYKNETSLKIDFAFTDEFGQESRLIKTVTNAVFIDKNQFEFLVDEFKLFLIASGYSPETVDAIQIIEG